MINALFKNLMIGLVLTAMISTISCTKRPVYRTNPVPVPEPKTTETTPPPRVSETPPPPVTPRIPDNPVTPPPPPKAEVPPPTPPQPTPSQGNILEDFENMAEWGFRAFPEEVTGSVETFTLEVHDGVSSGRLNYDFSRVPVGKTGAGYMAANKIIPLDAKEIKVWVYGNGSGHWLRVRFVDAKGIKYVADFARRIDWSNQWRECTISMENITSFDDSQKNLRPQMPLTTEFIYLVCEREGKRDQGRILFDNLLTR